jgi:hypothetical protein
MIISGWVCSHQTPAVLNLTSVDLWSHFYSLPSIMCHASRVSISNKAHGVFLSLRQLCLTKEPGCDVTHVSFLELVVLAVHAIDANILERSYYGRDVEAHIAEPFDEVFVETAIARGSQQYATLN